jgi:8-oxo-dGTP pyrophosphatase MutT (NUDIX family)
MPVLAILQLMIQEGSVPRRSGSRPIAREDVRSRLQAACGPTEPAGSSREPGIPAAVLVGLLAHPGGPHVILTERAAHLRDHAAEISLPGGRIEAGDEGPAAAALREAFEEIGLAPERVELLGCLPVYKTVTGFRVFPFVGWIEPPVEFVLETHEVAAVFQVPLSFVLDPANHRRESMVRHGELHTYYVLPYPGYRIWGATAGILVRLARVLDVQS